ncbi:long-chain-fatty-acid--CoA ligase 4-like [Tropilaelaps mercedesae]|uniref:long-chain-fatty-acid--CoA ligase n=1 Tax=Tropilaelaps mercedesae TaxID=418985 RepID=A0A1V9WZC2_9ACAR|nr:long-chain-fatty-acid--CoA ligase 4-like [Tropilaelaps mercedesae]
MYASFVCATVRWFYWCLATPKDATVYDKDVFDKIRTVVGGRVRMVATGSAPLSPETHDFIRAALGCHVIQGYGLTETCAAATCMEFTDNTTGGVGAPVSGAYIRLADWTQGHYLVKENKGEIILGGDMVARGYFKNPQLTEECFFEEGGIRWFRTGDIGEVTPLGSFKIIDRKKDLVKLQHGEYVSLGKIETELKTNQFVEHICVCGSAFQTYLVALVQVCEKNLKILAREADKNPQRKIRELCADRDITKTLLANLQMQLRKRGFQRIEIPQKLTLCPDEWTPASELVTAAFKLRRKQIEERYKAEIDHMYSSN